MRSIRLAPPSAPDRRLLPGREPGRQIALWWSTGGRLDLKIVLDANAFTICRAGLKSHARRSHVERMLAAGVNKTLYVNFDAPEFDREWLDARTNTHGSIGGIYQSASLHGWETARAPWGLGRALRDPKRLSDQAMAVQEAGAKLPHGCAIDRLRIVWLGQVISHSSRGTSIPIADSAGPAIRGLPPCSAGAQPARNPDVCVSVTPCVNWAAIAFWPCQTVVAVVPMAGLA